MRGTVSPGMAAFLIAIIVAVVVAFGYRMFGRVQAADNIGAAAKSGYSQKRDMQRDIELRHMGSGPAPAMPR